MKMNVHMIVVVGFALVMTACAHTEKAGGYGAAEPSGFLKKEDYAKLKPGTEDTDETLMYVGADTAKFKTYTKVWLEPVTVWRGEKSSAKDLDKEDADYVAQYLQARLNEELQKDYTMVQEAGPNVVRVRFGITEAEKGIPGLDNITALHPGALLISKGKKQISGTESFVGATTIEMKLTDSQTDELLVAAVDRRGGGKYVWKSLNRWEDFEQAADYYAKHLRWRACKMRGESQCEMPEE